MCIETIQSASQPYSKHMKSQESGLIRDIFEIVSFVRDIQCADTFCVESLCIHFFAVHLSLSILSDPQLQNQACVPVTFLCR